MNDYPTVTLRLPWLAHTRLVAVATAMDLSDVEAAVELITARYHEQFGDVDLNQAFSKAEALGLEVEKQRARELLKDEL
jgi:hypothetical protein